MPASLVTDALRLATLGRSPQLGLMSLSDPGNQHCSSTFQNALAGYEMRAPVRRGCIRWGNVQPKSPRGHLEGGGLYGKQFATQRQVIEWLAF